MHYAVTNAGGKSPNVVQAEAEEYFVIRAPKVSQVREIYEKVCDVARGAALMTGTQVEIAFDSAVSNYIPNSILQKLAHKNFMELGIPDYTQEDFNLAKDFRAILTEEEIKAVGNLDPTSKNKMKGQDIACMVNEFDSSEKVIPGSTDVSDVSWVIPTAQITVACAALGTQLHTWKWVAQGVTSIAHKGMLHAGKVLAATGVELLENPELVEKAKLKLKERLGGENYVCPIPENIKPSKTSRG